MGPGPGKCIDFCQAPFQFAFTIVIELRKPYNHLLTNPTR